MIAESTPQLTPKMEPTKYGHQARKREEELQTRRPEILIRHQLDGFILSIHNAESFARGADESGFAAPPGEVHRSRAGQQKSATEYETSNSSRDASIGELASSVEGFTHITDR